MIIKNYKDLKVWQKSRILVKQIYEVSALFPQDERFGLTNQIRRAAISIPSNLAEGHARSGSNDYLRFLSIAIGSLSEVETQLILAEDLGFLNAEDAEKPMQLINELQKMLHTLRKSLKPKT